MAISLKKISKVIDLDLSNVPKKKQPAVKKEVGEFVVDEILRSVSEGQSPVNRRGKFKILNKDYAKEQKGGNRNPNLDLFGDMLDSLTFKNNTKGVEVGIFNPGEVPKADGHNNFSGKSSLPTRRFIPKDGETFKTHIKKGVADILKDFTKEEIAGIKGTLAAVSIDELFNDEFLDQFLRDEGFIDG